MQRGRLMVGLRIAIGVIVLAALIVIGGVVGVAAVPESCLSCHGTDKQPLEVRPGHADVECRSCHGGTTAVERVDFAGRQIWGMYLGLPLEDRTTATVNDLSCTSCHETSADSPEGAAIRINHVTCTVDRTCTDCHSRVAHGDSVSWPREYDMFDCVPCHLSSAKSVECDLCHAQRSPEERVRTGTFALTHGSEWRTTHGMGDSLACAACHTAEKCVSCHGAGVPHTAAFAVNHSKYAVQENAQCSSCHAQKFCDDCHGIEMPHPAGFTPQHSAIVKAEGQATCERCHAPSDCVECHVKHVHPGNARKSGN